MDNILRYPAVFYPDEDAISVFFPDLPGCYTYGDNIEHAYDMAKEALEGWLEVQLEKGNAPTATSVSEVTKTLTTGGYDDEVITHKIPDSFVMILEVDKKLLKIINRKATRINTSIPAWLKAAAEERKINFSRVLQEGLKAELEVTNN